MFLLVTPWFRPWYTVGLLALVVSLGPGPLSAAVLTFSGTSLITSSGLVGTVGQAAVRYVPPAAVYRRFSRAEATRSAPRPANRS